MSDEKQGEAMSLKPRTAFWEAFHAFQGELPRVEKEGNAQRYKYVQLHDALNALYPVLQKHGLTVHHETFMREGDLVIRAVLRHVGGHRQESELAFPVGKIEVKGGLNLMQAMGSIITYSRRYTLMAVTGMTDGLDDDGAKAGDEPSHKDPKMAKVLVQAKVDDELKRYNQEIHLTNTREDAIAAAQTALAALSGRISSEREISLRADWRALAKLKPLAADYEPDDNPDQVW